MATFLMNLKYLKFYLFLSYDKILYSLYIKLKTETAPLKRQNPNHFSNIANNVLVNYIQRIRQIINHHSKSIFKKLFNFMQNTAMHWNFMFFFLWNKPKTKWQRVIIDATHVKNMFRTSRN